MVVWFGLLVIGNGLFKPNIATLVGSLYAPGDTRRDGAFSYFYFAVNVGGTISRSSEVICECTLAGALRFRRQGSG